MVERHKQGNLNIKPFFGGRGGEGKGTGEREGRGIWKKRGKEKQHWEHSIAECFTTCLMNTLHLLVCLYSCYFNWATVKEPAPYSLLIISRNAWTTSQNMHPSALCISTVKNGICCLLYLLAAIIIIVQKLLSYRAN